MKFMSGKLVWYEKEIPEIRLIFNHVYEQQMIVRDNFYSYLKYYVITI